MLSEIDNAIISSSKHTNQSEHNSLSLSDTKIQSNSTNNTTPIKVVENSLYKTIKNIVKDVGTC